MNPETKARLRRRVDEGAVIVFSILLAFAIDAWWAQRQVRNDERLVLAALRREFQANTDQLTRVADYQRAAQERVATLVTASPEELAALPQRAVSELMLAAACSPWTFDPVEGTMSALLSSGRLGILQDAELRAALTRFVNLIADADEDAAYMVADAQAVWRAEVDLGGPWTDPATEVAVTGPIRGLDFIPRATAEDLLRVREDATHMGRVRRYYLNAAYYIAELDRLRSQSELVLELIGEAEES